MLAKQKQLPCPVDVLRGVGRRVAELRAARGLTQVALAERLDVTTRYVQKVEAGKANLSVLALVEWAGALGAHPRALFE